MKIPFTPSFRTTLGVLCLLLGLLGGLRGGALGGLIAIPVMFMAAICLYEPIGAFFADLINGMLYRKSYLKVAPQRVAAAESLAAQNRFEEAQEAFEAILAEEPDCLPALLSYVRMLLAWQEDGAHEKAAERLSSWLARHGKAQPGGISAVLLLVDLLQENGCDAQAQAILEQELAKGYCKADGHLIKLRLKSLEKTTREP